MDMPCHLFKYDRTFIISLLHFDQTARAACVALPSFFLAGCTKGQLSKCTENPNSRFSSRHGLDLSSCLAGYTGGNLCKCWEASVYFFPPSSLVTTGAPFPLLLAVPRRSGSTVRKPSLHLLFSSHNLNPLPFIVTCNKCHKY